MYCAVSTARSTIFPSTTMSPLSSPFSWSLLWSLSSPSSPPSLSTSSLLSFSFSFSFSYTLFSATTSVSSTMLDSNIEPSPTIISSSFPSWLSSSAAPLSTCSTCSICSTPPSSFSIHESPPLLLSSSCKIRLSLFILSSILSIKKRCWLRHHFRWTISWICTAANSFSLFVRNTSKVRNRTSLSLPNSVASFCFRSSSSCNASFNASRRSFWPRATSSNSCWRAFASAANSFLSTSAAVSRKVKRCRKLSNSISLCSRSFARLLSYIPMCSVSRRCSSFIAWRCDREDSSPDNKRCDVVSDDAWAPIAPLLFCCCWCWLVAEKDDINSNSWLFDLFFSNRSAVLFRMESCLLSCRFREETLSFVLSKDSTNIVSRGVDLWSLFFSSSSSSSFSSSIVESTDNNSIISSCFCCSSLFPSYFPSSFSSSFPPSPSTTHSSPFHSPFIFFLLSILLILSIVSLVVSSSPSSKFLNLSILCCTLFLLSPNGEIEYSSSKLGKCQPGPRLQSKQNKLSYSNISAWFNPLPWCADLASPVRNDKWSRNNWFSYNKKPRQCNCGLAQGPLIRINLFVALLASSCNNFSFFSISNIFFVGAHKSRWSISSWAGRCQPGPRSQCQHLGYSSSSEWGIYLTLLFVLLPSLSPPSNIHPCNFWTCSSVRVDRSTEKPLHLTDNTLQGPAKQTMSATTTLLPFSEFVGDLPLVLPLMLLPLDLDLFLSLFLSSTSSLVGRCQPAPRWQRIHLVYFSASLWGM